MAWEGYEITQPDEIADYKQIVYGWHDGWVFGLPDAPGQISYDCGAMPFRTENGDGLKAKKCLRGEDWAWIKAWFYTRSSMPANDIFGGLSSSLPYLTYEYPTLAQLQEAMDFTSQYWSRFGQSYDLSNQIVTHGNYRDVLKTGLVNNATMNQHIPDELNGDWELSSSVNVPLKQTYVENIFSDLSVLKCTLGTCYGNTSELYSWYQLNPSSTPTTNSRWLSGLYHYDNGYVHDSKIISMRAQPYIVLRLRHSDWSDTDEKERYMTYKVGSPRYVESTEAYPERFYYPSQVNGATIAQGAANLFGVDINPTATASSRGYFYVYPDYMYMAISAYYLQL